MLHPTAPWGALLAIAGAVLIWATRQGSAAGAFIGLMAALLAASGFGASAIAPLAIFVLGSGAATRVGRAEKERLGTAERDQGRRGPAHAAAKLSLPALVGALAVVERAPVVEFMLVYSATLAGAFADTAATELGPLARGRVWGLRGLRLVSLPHGAPGGMSGAGLMAAAASSALLAWSASLVGLTRGAACVLIVAGSGFLASLFESAVAGTAVGARLGHFGRNVFVSAAAASLALAAWALGWTEP